MMSYQIRKQLFFLSLLVITNFGPGKCINSTDIWSGFSRSCDVEDPHSTSLSCHGIRIIRKVVQQLLLQSAVKSKVEIFNGISLAESDSKEPFKHRSFGDAGDGDSILNFLQNRELRIRLPSLLPDNVEPALRQTLKEVAQGRGSGGKGGKKGNGGMMAVMLMCKMMATMGFGALGFLAMKALMVSALALMLSLIVAAKKLHSGGGDDHAHVVYAQESHHRKKRSNEILEDFAFSPYRGYVETYAKVSSTS